MSRGHPGVDPYRTASENRRPSTLRDVQARLSNLCGDRDTFKMADLQRAVNCGIEFAAFRQLPALTNDDPQTPA